MATRRKTSKKTEVDTTKDISVEEAIELTDEQLEVTEEFVLQEEAEVTDVSDVAVMDEVEMILDTTEVEAAIEDGSKIELVEEKKAAKIPTPDRPMITENQKMATIKPSKNKVKDNNGIRTTQGMFFR